LAIKNAQDNSFKVIFQEPELLIQFLQDYVRLDVFDDIRPEDIEDVSERFTPLFQEAKDSDTVKRIRLKGDASVFVIAILEHQSGVDYKTSFRMLQYVTLVLTEYEREAERAREGSSSLKGFRYPPVLPLVFYDGTNKWTAETNFVNKTQLSV
jgi:predicted transposase/invertase (TIGR01784 family)